MPWKKNNPGCGVSSTCGCEFEACTLILDLIDDPLDETSQGDNFTVSSGSWTAPLTTSSDNALILWNDPLATNTDQFSLLMLNALQITGNSAAGAEVLIYLPYFDANNSYYVRYRSPEANKPFTEVFLHQVIGGVDTIIQSGHNNVGLLDDLLLRFGDQPVQPEPYYGPYNVSFLSSSVGSSYCLSQYITGEITREISRLDLTGASIGFATKNLHGGTVVFGTALQIYKGVCWTKVPCHNWGTVVDDLIYGFPPTIGLADSSSDHFVGGPDPTPGYVLSETGTWVNGRPTAASSMRVLDLPTHHLTSQPYYDLLIAASECYVSDLPVSDFILAIWESDESNILLNFATDGYLRLYVDGVMVKECYAIITSADSDNCDVELGDLVFPGSPGILKMFLDYHPSGVAYCSVSDHGNPFFTPTIGVGFAVDIDKTFGSPPRPAYGVGPNWTSSDQGYQVVLDATESGCLLNDPGELDCGSANQFCGWMVTFLLCGGTYPGDSIQRCSEFFPGGLFLGGVVIDSDTNLCYTVVNIVAYTGDCSTFCSDLANFSTTSDSPCPGTTTLQCGDFCSDVPAGETLALTFTLSGITPDTDCDDFCNELAGIYTIGAASTTADCNGHTNSCGGSRVLYFTEICPCATTFGDKVCIISWCIDCTDPGGGSCTVHLYFDFEPGEPGFHDGVVSYSATISADCGASFTFNKDSSGGACCVLPATIPGSFSSITYKGACP